MYRDFLVDQIEAEINALTSHFNELEDEFKLTVNSTSITFLKCDSEFDVKPNEWIKHAHQSGRIHEPGMVAVLSFLSKKLKKKVIFYDIGALFGYFSSIVKAMLPNSKIILIEGNPLSCNCIKKISPQLSSEEILNVVLGDEERFTNYLISGFALIDTQNRIRAEKFRIWIINIIKAILNLFGKKYQMRKVYSYNIKQETVQSIFKEQKSSQVEIFKFDAEGNQCRFLPPFINELCSRNPIVLLEMDSSKKMASFGMTNNEILQLFLDRGYVCYWLNHRMPLHVKRVFKITKEEDFNSLLFLIPKELADEISTAT
jgi:FkbM family methyltransferase